MIGRQLEHKQILEMQQHLEDFRRLYEMHYCDVFNQVQKRINNELISADITHQVFLEAIKSVKKYNLEQFPLSTHLYRTVINRCTKFFNSSCNKRRLVINEEMSVNILDQVGIMPCYEKKTNSLIKALEILTIQEIELLELRFVENKMFQEQGYIMNMPENTAKLRTYSLLNKIKQLMKSDSAALKTTNKVEIVDRAHAVPKQKIKSYMCFDLLWEEFNSSKASVFQILREAISYIDGRVLKRTFVSFGIILVFGVFAFYFLDKKTRTTELEEQPDIQIEKFNNYGVDQIDSAHSTDLACLNVSSIFLS